MTVSVLVLAGSAGAESPVVCKGRGCADTLLNTRKRTESAPATVSQALFKRSGLEITRLALPPKRPISTKMSKNNVDGVWFVAKRVRTLAFFVRTEIFSAVLQHRSKLLAFKYKFSLQACQHAVVVLNLLLRTFVGVFCRFQFGLN